MEPKELWDLSEKEMRDAINVELNYVGESNTNMTSGKLYFKDAVLNELKQIPSIPDSLLTTGGIKIYTTGSSDWRRCGCCYKCVFVCLLLYVTY